MMSNGARPPSRIVPKADPGIGREHAPIGSEAWAQRVRLEMQSLVNHVGFKPDNLRRYVDMVNERRAWTLMNKPDGSYFTSFEDFCAFRQPYGLGKPWAEIRPFVEAAMGPGGKKAIDLVTVAPAQTPPPPPAHVGPGRGHKTDEDTVSPSVSDSDGEDRKAKRLRAILRAPEAVQELYRAGLIGQVVAAKLGPKDGKAGPDPARAAKLADVVRVAIAEAATETPTTEKDKRRVKRRVNEAVRGALGTKKGDGAPPARAADYWRARALRAEAIVAALTAKQERAGSAPEPKAWSIYEDNGDASEDSPDKPWNVQDAMIEFNRQWKQHAETWRKLPMESYNEDRAVSFVCGVLTAVSQCTPPHQAERLANRLEPYVSEWFSGLRDKAKAPKKPAEAEPVDDAQAARIVENMLNRMVSGSSAARATIQVGKPAKKRAKARKKIAAKRRLLLTT